MKNLIDIYILKKIIKDQINIRFCKFISKYTGLFSSYRERKLHITKVSNIISIFLSFFIQINSINCDETESLKSVESQNQNS
jgi:hypothetical protein